MTITIRELQTAGTNSGTNTHTFTLGSATATTDTLVVVHANDWGVLADVTSPTGTAASTWTSQLSFDGGTNTSHIKVFTAPVTTAGAQTVIGNQSGPDADWFAAVWVLQGGPTWDGGVTSNAAAGSISWPAASVTPVSGQTDDLLFNVWTNNDSGSAVWNVSSYPGAPFSGFTEVDVGTFCTFAGGTEQLSSASATGTRTLTTSSATAWCAVSFVMKATAGGPPPLPDPVALQSGQAWPGF